MLAPSPASPLQAPVDSPNPSTGAPAPAPLLGPPPAQEPTQAAPSPEQQSQAFMMEVRELTMRITSLARQYPAGAEDWEFAIQSLINGMTKSVIAQSSTEPMSAPNLVG